MKYAGFWRRAASLFIDGLLVAPLIALEWFLFGVSPGVAIASVVLIGILWSLYPIYFHGRWGQTVGKMAAKIKVVQVDGSPITPRHAVVRNSVDLVMWSIYVVGTVLVLATWDGPDWSSLGLLEQRRLVNEGTPFFGAYDVISQAWFWSEVLVLLFNKKRRALHDFIAGTVVVRVAQDEVHGLVVPRPVIDSESANP